MSSVRSARASRDLDSPLACSLSCPPQLLRLNFTPYLKLIDVVSALGMKESDVESVAPEDPDDHEIRRQSTAKWISIHFHVGLSVISSYIYTACTGNIWKRILHCNVDS